jgi:hypothetical protein
VAPKPGRAARLAQAGWGALSWALFWALFGATRVLLLAATGVTLQTAAWQVAPLLLAGTLTGGLLGALGLLGERSALSLALRRLPGVLLGGLAIGALGMLLHPAAANPAILAGMLLGAYLQERLLDWKR